MFRMASRSSLSLASAVALVLLLPTRGHADVPTSPSSTPAPSNDTPQPTSGPTGEALERYTRAMSHYNNGDYRLALIEMQRAYELAPSYRILYNLGRIHQQLNNWSKALVHLERYLDEGGSEVPAERKAEVLRELESLRLKVAHIQLTANAKLSRVSVDGRQVDRAEWEKGLTVDAGPSHKIRVEADGYQPAERDLELAGAERIAVVFRLEKVPEQPLFLEAKRESPRWVWTSWSAAGALGVAAAATGIVAYQQAQKLDDLKDTPNVLGNDITSTAQRARSFAIVSTVLTGAAVVAGGAGLYFTIRYAGSSRRDQKRAVVTPGLGSLSLSGEF